jgi:hypothetical protein
MSGPPDSFTGDWITPGHSDYSKAIARWAANAERRAKVVAFVKSAQDVAVVLRYAKQQNLPLAVRGGGHSPAGASSIENGIVIDLSRHLSKVRVDPIAKLAYVCGGAIWETVDKTAIEHGLATVAGTINHTGVGGLLLGGGYGFLTGEHGLALDNLVQATVVTARGDILTASSTENPDLFWALRGAGCNFGVVTEFVLRLHPQRRTVFAGIIAYPPPAIPKAVSVLGNSWKIGLSDKECVIYAQTADPAGNPMALFILFWNGSEEEGRAHFKPYFEIGPVMDTCKEIPFEQLNSLQNSHAVHGKNYYMKGVFSSEPQLEVVDKLVSRLPQIRAESGANLTVLYELIPTKKILSIPNHATAHIRGCRINVLISADWDSKDTDILDKVRKATSDLGQIVVQGEKIIPESLNVGYGNYNTEEIVSAVGSSGSKANSQALFGENYARLQKLKREYDPDLVFFKWCPITPQA